MAYIRIKRKLSAFTLVELLVVIAIISVLAGMLMPALENAIDSARQIKCLNNQKQIGMSFMMYSDDHDGYVVLTDGNYSWAWTYDATKPREITTHTGVIIHTGYIEDVNLFCCPKAPPYGVYNTPEGKNTWYVYGVLIGDLPSEASLNLPSGSGSIKYLITKLLKKPGASMGVADSINRDNKQMQGIYPTASDANFQAGQFIGRHHLRHNDLANTWFYDGHAKPIDITGVAEIAKTGGKAHNSTVYAMDENFETVTGLVD